MSRDTEWRYLPHGKVKHAMLTAHSAFAHCGVSTWDSAQWCGTGTQREYERVTELPKCRNCVRTVGEG